MYFIDVLKAYPYMLRGLLFDIPGSDERLFHRIHNSDVPPALVPRIIARLQEFAVWRGDDGSPHLHYLLEERHRQTWFTTEFLSGASCTPDGACTGNALADLVVTGEGMLDAESLHGKVVGGVVELAAGDVLVLVGSHKQLDEAEGVLGAE